MLQGEKQGILSNLGETSDFSLSKKMANEVQGMDIEVQQSVAFRICAGAVMQVVIQQFFGREFPLQ